jgi:hypothetical protein
MKRRLLKRQRRRTIRVRLFNNANCYACGTQWKGRQTAPVGSFPPNAFGNYGRGGGQFGPAGGYVRALESRAHNGLLSFQCRPTFVPMYKIVPRRG